LIGRKRPVLDASGVEPVEHKAGRHGVEKFHVFGVICHEEDCAIAEIKERMKIIGKDGIYVAPLTKLKVTASSSLRKIVRPLTRVITTTSTRS
jgi:hypothetical protein